MLIILDARIENRLNFRRQDWSGMKKKAMQAVGQYWIDNILDLHFAASNRSRYRMEKRNRFYKLVVKKIEGEGEGKTVDLQLKGKSRRWLKAFAKITATQNRATIRMHGPAYFANPKVGKVQKTITTKQGGQKEITINISHQPDKVAELTQVNNADRLQLEQVFFDHVREGVKKLIG